MKRKKRLEARMARLLAKKNSLDARCKASTDVNEVREMTEQLDDINADIADIQAEIDEIDAEERAKAQDAEKRSTAPAGTACKPRFRNWYSCFKHTDRRCKKCRPLQHYGVQKGVYGVCTARHTYSC